MRLEHAMLGLMLGVGAAAWWLFLTPALRIDATSLAALPTRIGSWTSRDLPLGEGVERILRADFNLQREYVRAAGEPPVWLYVGYYGTARGGRPEHTPDVCYPAAGWEIARRATVVLDEARGLHATEYLVAQGGWQRLVHYWYRSRTRTGLPGLLPLAFEHLRGRVAEGRADGALVRISTPIGPEGPGGARARLRTFAPLVDPLIGEHWPDELPGA